MRVLCITMASASSLPMSVCALEHQSRLWSLKPPEWVIEWQMLYIARSCLMEMQLSSVPVCTRKFEYMSFPCVSSMSPCIHAAGCIVLIDVVEQSGRKPSNTYSYHIFCDRGRHGFQRRRHSWSASLRSTSRMSFSKQRILRCLC
jgi:hypothetical protein